MDRIHRSPSRLATHLLIGALLVTFGTNFVRAHDSENRLESPSLSAGKTRQLTHFWKKSSNVMAIYEDMIGEIGKDPARDRGNKFIENMESKARNGNILDKGMNYLLRPAGMAVVGVQVGNQEWRRGNRSAAMTSYGGAAANTVAFLLILAAPVLLIMSIFLPSRRRAGRRRKD